MLYFSRSRTNSDLMRDSPASKIHKWNAWNLRLSFECLSSLVSIKKKQSFGVSAENIGSEKALKIPCFLSVPLCLTTNLNHYWKTVYCTHACPIFLRWALVEFPCPEWLHWLATFYLYYICTFTLHTWIVQMADTILSQFLFYLFSLFKSKTSLFFI